MCFATLNLPGSCSTSLEAGFKLPWRKDRSSSARKDAKSTAEESSDLLAKARAYERAGDFPNATRAYRQYLEEGGSPQAMKQTDETADAVTKSDNKPSSTESRDKSEGNGRNAGSRAKADTRLTSKSKEKAAKKAKNNRVWVRLYSKFLKKPIMRNYASAVGNPDPKFSASNFNPL